LPEVFFFLFSNENDEYQKKMPVLVSRKKAHVCDENEVRFFETGNPPLLFLKGLI